jgi:hypothetical protein
MVAGADDAAREKDRRRQQGRRRGDARSDQIEPHEDEGDHRGGEDLEEPFDPQDERPTIASIRPSTGACAVPMSAPHRRTGNGSGGHGQQCDQLLLLARLSQSRKQHTNHQEQPEQQSDHQGDLPDSPQIDVLVSLMTQVERNRSVSLL